MELILKKDSTSVDLIAGYPYLIFSISVSAQLLVIFKGYMATQMLCALPVHVLFSILASSDLESLIQLKLVNKFFYNLIKSFLEDPKFIAHRFKKLTNVDTVICDPAHGILVSHNGLVHAMVDMPIHMSSKICHCNGIICVSNDIFKETYLINPANKEYHRLPHSVLHNKYLVSGMGLGFDPRVDDFNALRFGINSDQRTVVELYSLRTDSWRIITAPIPLRYYCKVLKSIFCRGVYYWSFYGMKNNFILCFNMDKEEFHKLPLPEDFQSLEKSWTISDLEGSFSLIAYPGDPTKDLVIEVWVLDGVSPTVQHMWKKLVVVGPLQPDIQGTPTNFWKTNELLIISPEGYASSICTQT